MFDVGALLLQKGLVAAGDLSAAREVQMRKGGDLGRICVDMGLADDGALATALSEALAVPRIALSAFRPDPGALAKIPRVLAESLCALPCALRDGGQILLVALANPADEAARLALARASGCAVKVAVAGWREIEAALSVHYPREEAPVLAPAEDFAGDGPLQITDLSGHLLVTLAPEPPAAARAAAPPPGAVTPPAAPDPRRLLATLEESIGRTGSAIHALLALCVERGVFTAEELLARLRR